MIPKATIAIAAICIFVYLLEFIYPSQLMAAFSLDSSEILSAPWTLITYMFLHASNQHIFYNIFGLVIFGMVLESIIGTRRFVMLYLASGVASGMAGLAFYSSMVGASGAVFGIIGCLAVLRPKMQVWILFITAPMAIAAIFYVLFDMIGIFLPDNIAHIAHLAGMGVGLSYGMALRLFFKEGGDKENSDIGDDNDGDNGDKSEPLSESEMEEWEEENMVKDPE